MEQALGLDSVVFIYLLENNLEYGERAAAILRRVQTGQTEAVLASLAVIEILTGPKKQDRFDLAAAYKVWLASFPNLTIWGITERVVDLASDLRARYGISTPDAIHIASAIDFGALKFVTNDKELKRVKEINVELP